LNFINFRDGLFHLLPNENSNTENVVDFYERKGLQLPYSFLIFLEFFQGKNFEMPSFFIVMLFFLIEAAKEFETRSKVPA